MDAKKERSRIVAARSGKKVNVLAAEDNNGNRVLKDAEVKFYGSEARALLESRVVRNILSKSFADCLLVIPEITNKHITVTNGVKSSILALLTGFPV